MSRQARQLSGTRSYHVIFRGINYLNRGNLADTAFSLTMVGRDEWIRLHNIFKKENFEVSGRIPMSDEQIRRKIQLIIDGREPYEIAFWLETERDTVIRQLKGEGLSIRKFERITGISQGIVAKY